MRRNKPRGPCFGDCFTFIPSGGQFGEWAQAQSGSGPSIWLRGIAVVVMIQTHALALLRPELRAGDFFTTLQWIDGLVAPAFIFAAGFRARPDAGARGARLRLRRGAQEPLPAHAAAALRGAPRRHADELDVVPDSPASRVGSCASISFFNCIPRRLRPPCALLILFSLAPPPARAAMGCAPARRAGVRHGAAGRARSAAARPFPQHRLRLGLSALALGRLRLPGRGGGRDRGHRRPARHRAVARGIDWSWNHDLDPDSLVHCHLPAARILGTNPANCARRWPRSVWSRCCCLGAERFWPSARSLACASSRSLDRHPWPVISSTRRCSISTSSASRSTRSGASTNPGLATWLFSRC